MARGPFLGLNLGHVTSDAFLGQKLRIKINIFRWSSKFKKPLLYRATKMSNGVKNFIQSYHKEF